MKKVILLAGYPATGKTYMSNIIKQQHPTAIYLAQDEVKEMLYDMIGFNNLVEKDELVEFGRTIFYNIVEKSVEQNEIVILDYPFSYKQLDFLNTLKRTHNCEFFTIRLTGDLDILYDRRIERDLVPTRNKGHILSNYHGYETYTRDTYPLSRKEYKQNCINGKYNQFEFCSTLAVDVSDYDAINYDMILMKISKFIGE